MKKPLSILALLGIAIAALANLPFGHEDSIGFNASSYSEISLGHYMSAAISLNNPADTNHFIDHSRSGSSLNADAQDQIDKWLAPASASCVGNHYDLYLVTDNGGAGHDTMLLWLTNYHQFPTNVWNGSTYVASSGWEAAHSVTYLSGGGIPADASDGGSAAEQRDQAAVDYATTYETYQISLWNALWPLIQTDQAGNRYFWNSLLGGGHPSCAGCLLISIKWLKALGADTVVNATTLDWETGLHVATNHCVVWNESRSDNTLTFTWHAMRHSMAWDIPNATTGITNDARHAFDIEPSLTNAFYEGFQLTNCPDGKYDLIIDGRFDATLTGAQLRAGYNIFTDYNNDIWDQRVEVLGLTRDQYGNDRITLAEYSGVDVGRDQVLNQQNLKSNEKGAYDDDGLRGDAMIAAVQTAVHDVRFKDALINLAAQPVDHTIQLRFHPNRYRIRK